MTAQQVRALRRSLKPSTAERAQRKTEKAPFYPREGLTLREAAARVGVCMSSWHRWERGKTITRAMGIALLSLQGLARKGFYKVV